MNLARTESIGESRHDRALAHYERQLARSEGLAEHEEELAIAELARLRAEFAGAPTASLIAQCFEVFGLDEASVVLTTLNPENHNLVARCVRFFLAPMFEKALQRIAEINAERMVLAELQAAEARDRVLA